MKIIPKNKLQTITDFLRYTCFVRTKRLTHFCILRKIDITPVFSFNLNSKILYCSSYDQILQSLILQHPLYRHVGMTKCLFLFCIINTEWGELLQHIQPSDEVLFSFFNASKFGKSQTGAALQRAALIAATPSSQTTQYDTVRRGRPPGVIGLQGVLTEFTLSRRKHTAL